jgi:DNA gyrase subunit A
MATNIPPHNLREILTACIALVQARKDETEVTDKELYRMVPAPDFPTGASIMGTSGARQLYSTGNGGVVMRAVTHIEQIATGKKSSPRTAIIVTELPYQVNKAALLEKIAALVNDKKLEGIADLRDESDRDGIRMVIELKRDAVAAIVLNNLYKKTALQSSFSGNFLALMSSDSDADSESLAPQRFTLRRALDVFLDFRFQTIRRKARFELSKVAARAHIVDGLRLALEKVDVVIDIVRSAADQKAAREALQEELGTTEEQTDSILRLQLGQLTRLNKGKLEAEKADLERSREELTALLEVDNEVYDVMTAESKDLITKFGVDRKSRIEIEDDGDLSEIDLVKNSRSVIVVTRGGYIKRMPLMTFESQGRGTRGKRGTSDGGESVDNEIMHCFTCNDHDTLLMVTQAGIAYGLRAYKVPISSRTAKGQPIPSVLPVRSDDVVTAILPIDEFTEEKCIVLTTEQGWIKKTPLKAFERLTTRGLTIATLGDDDRLNWCQLCRDGDDILLGSVMGIATRFSTGKLRPTGRTSRGVRAMKMKPGDTIADMSLLSGTDSDENFVLAVTKQGYGKLVGVDEFKAQGRGGVGVIAIKFKKSKEEADVVTCLRAVRKTDEILVITAKGIMVRQQASSIPSQGRTATGVKIQKLDGGDRISSVSIVPRYEETETDQGTA